ncbi:MAG: hypothetical protein ACK4WM_00175 [Thermoflexales bacterium]
MSLRRAAARAAAGGIGIGLAAMIWLANDARLPESAQINSPISPLPTVTSPPPTATERVFTPTPSVTTTVVEKQDLNATSTAVVATITALAATPTYPPVATRRPVGSGGDSIAITPTPIPVTSNPQGIALLSLSSQVYRGGVAALAVRAQPADVCVLRLLQRGQAGEPVEMTPQPPDAARQTDSQGMAAWLWEVKADSPTGIWVAEVNCRQSGIAQYDVEVLP